MKGLLKDLFSWLGRFIIGSLFVSDLYFKVRWKSQGSKIVELLLRLRGQNMIRRMAMT
jgi:hypothetical protein